jgi:heterodisulfide reductase subunit D
MNEGPDGILRLIELGQMERVLTSRDIWLCLGCGMCGAHCPNGIDAGQIMIALRQIAAEQGYRREDCEQLREQLAAQIGTGTTTATVHVHRSTPQVDERLCAGVQRLNRLGHTVVETHNVSGDENEGRTIWSQNLAHVPEGMVGRRSADLIYFVGCVGAFYPQSYRVPQAMTRILGAAGADFTTLGGQEWCCGYPLLALGEIEEARRLALHNVARVRELEAARLVTTCPSCYHMWKSIYPDLGADLSGEVAIVHATELLTEFLRTERLPLGELPLRVTYHDPCDLGRKSGVYDAPRQVLGHDIPGLSFVEMSGAGQISECCGGGGNLASFDPEVVNEIALRRVGRACEVGAQALISACQQCERTLMAAVRRHPEARRARLRVMDITELVCQAMDAPRPVGADGGRRTDDERQRTDDQGGRAFHSARGEAN